MIKQGVGGGGEKGGVEERKDGMKGGFVNWGGTFPQLSRLISILVRTASPLLPLTISFTPSVAQTFSLAHSLYLSPTSYLTHTGKWLRE